VIKETGMSSNLLYLIGPPGVGKSSAMAVLTAKCDRMAATGSVAHDLLVRAHQWHGNTTLVCSCGDRPNGWCRTCHAERISVVAYYRTRVQHCGSPEEELRKA
jgi:hypothetical protein